MALIGNWDACDRESPLSSYFKYVLTISITSSAASSPDFELQGM